MTPSNPSPDTGAGKPPDDGRPWPEAVTEDEVMRIMSSDNPRSRYHRESRVDGWSGWTCIPLVDVIQLRADALDAARSRPATDPAGLDAIVDRCRQHIAGLGADLLTIKAREATSAQRDAAADRAYAHLKGIDTILTDALARLSVADGPGPEERLSLRDAGWRAVQSMSDHAKGYERGKADALAGHFDPCATCGDYRISHFDGGDCGEECEVSCSRFAALPVEETGRS